MREIVGASHNPRRKLTVLYLRCGHRLLLRVDTPMGRSYHQTVWRAAPCYQCTGNETLEYCEGSG